MNKLQFDRMEYGLKLAKLGVVKGCPSFGRGVCQNAGVDQLGNHVILDRPVD